MPCMWFRSDSFLVCVMVCVFLSVCVCVPFGVCVRFFAQAKNRLPKRIKM
jgi:hypothetical protein